MTLTASQGSLSQSAAITVTAPAKKNAIPSSSQVTAVSPIDLSCDSSSVASGHRLGCEVRFNRASTSDSLQVSINSSAHSLAAPATVGIRAGQQRVRFEVEADSTTPNDTAILEARVGEVSLQHSVALHSSGSPSLTAPAEVSGTPGNPIRFNVSARDPQSLDVVLGAADLPDGAAFDPKNGVFQWTPSDRDLGTHQLTITASNTLGASSTHTVKLYIDSGLPIVTKIENGAGPRAPAGCSPGSIATIRGRSLLTGTDVASDVSGGSENLSGTRVLVNGIPVPVLFASASRVDLLCPAAMAGTSLAISVETAAGKSNELQTSMRESVPGLFTIGGAESGQALAAQDGSVDLAAIPNARFAAEPALAGDVVSFRATGIGCDTQTAARLSLRLGTYLIPAVAARPLDGHAGVCEVLASIPAVAGDAVPVTLVLLQSDGQQARSNEASIGVAERQ